ncbi:MAG: hypothetical protein U0736_02860 [Gemmataceae bacterium]
MTGKRVLSVGQCSMDHGSISHLLHSQFSARVLPVATGEEALGQLRRETYALVLVNRVFDATGESGLDFIRTVKGDADLEEVPMMLVSNYAETQEEAQAAGAAPGFGKAQLHERQTIENLRPFLGES